MLNVVADKNKMVAFLERTKAPGGQFVKISTFEHEGIKKIVLAWKLVKDVVYKGTNVAWVEYQQVEMLFEDNSKMVSTLADFYRKTADKVKAEVKKRELQPDD